jgi:hypothetical protein
VNHLTVNSRVRFELRFAHAGLSNPRVTLRILHLARYAVLYRIAMHRVSRHGGQYRFAASFVLRKSTAVGRDLADFSLFEGAIPVIGFDLSFSVGLQETGTTRLTAARA